MADVLIDESNGAELLQSSGHKMSQPKRVLLTNDDGPDSTFFQAWVKHVQGSLQ